MPKEVFGIKAPEMDCHDKNCAFHGTIKVHGRLITGVVKSAKPRKTVIVEVKRKVYIKKYERYADKTTRLYAHNPECLSAKEGDIVRIAQTRPISKTKNFVVLEVVKRKSEEEK
ncbi:30S ribosomal protein S17 [Candidatus Woesearchaeota archaeon ex4484_78]|nr:MAG: 30S ribosomal protein S17 [Candidatus Woesearchaeota archaeon ex4484_78]